MPPLKKKVLNEQELFEQELQLEADLGHQQREFTTLCHDRNGPSDSKSSKIMKQRKVIDILNKELYNVNNDLQIATAKGKKREDMVVSKHLVELLNEYDKFCTDFKKKKGYIVEMNFQLNKTERAVSKLKLSENCNVDSQSRILQAQKVLEGLENKLDVQIKKFCVICADNQKLREDITHLLRERHEFNIIWDRMITNLCIGKKFMLDLIEQATIAYDQREEWCSKLQALRQRAHVDLVLHMQEMRELQRKGDNDKKLSDFYCIKNQKRSMVDLEERERKKRQEKRDKINELVTDYSRILLEVQDFTKSTNLREIINNFSAKEGENFALFQHINQLNLEMEELNDEMSALYKEIDERKIIATKRLEQQQVNIDAWKKQLEEVQGKVAESEDEGVEVDSKLKKIYTGVEQLFKLCNCNKEPLLKLLGEMNTITDHNILLYLQILEKSMQNTMVRVYHWEKVQHEKKKLKQDARVVNPDKMKPLLYTLEQMVLSHPCPLCIEHELVGDVIDELQHIKTREHILKKLEQRLDLPNFMDTVHNVSACHLPKSRQIIQKRYQ